jgi:arylsulfatase A-like enzyme
VTFDAKPTSRDPGWRLAIRDALIMALCAGLVAGAAQVAIVLFRRDILGVFTFTTRDVIWMAPLSNVIMAIPLALVVMLLSVLTPGRIALVVSAWLCGAYAAYATVVLFPRLYQWAMALLSLGVAIRVAGAFRADPARSLSRTRRLALGLATTLAVLGLANRAVRTIAERRAMASLPSAPANSPNVLLLILDTVRATSLDLYGYARPTAPGITRIAGEGLVADWAIATAPWTLPSHGSMFTGRRPDELNARFLTALDGTHTTLAEVLRGHGYATGGFIANYNYTTHESGLDRGFIHFADYRLTFEEMVLTGSVSRIDSFHDVWSGILFDRSFRDVIPALLRHHFTTTRRYPQVHRKRAGDVTGDFLRWQSKLGDRPFFAFLNLFDAHTTYDPPAEFRTRFAASPTPQDLYDACIAYMDQEITALMGELQARGILDRTIVVITSDHGEQFGEHNKMQHANSLYSQTLRVPLVVRYPQKVPAGTRITRALSLQDLPATLLDLAGFAPTDVSGMSLTPSFTGPATRGSPPVSLLEQHEGFGVGHDSPELRSIFGDSLHYIVERGGVERLYAYRIDPFETNDLAADPAHNAALARLRDELRRSTGTEPYVMKR